LDLLVDSYNKKYETGIIILAADTTIEENIYANQLIDAGVPRKHIVSQACTDLANTISNDSEGGKIYLLIEKYLSLALKKIPDKCKNVIVYLGCTHYGYRQDLFTKFLLNKGVEFIIINPNNYFFNRIFKKTVRSNVKFDSITPIIEFVTHYPIPNQEINTISKYLSIVSPDTAQALQNYSVAEDLF
jgi:glutamate racemase